MSQGHIDSGIPCVGPLPWGTHFCQFYDSRADLADTLVPYFKAGLENNEGCLWVTSEPLGADQASAALRTAVPDLDRRMREGQIEILDHRQWYTRKGHFDADEVLAGWIAKKEAAIARGFDGLRLTGNTFWIEDQQGFKDFTDYEERLNQGFKQHQMVCVCSYCLSKTSARDVLDVVRSHEFAVTRRGGEWDVVESASLQIAKEQLRLANDELERKIAARTAHLECALADKDVLLREIHHRVKNNLHIVSSLLMLKGRALAAVGGGHIVNDILNRINAISLVHEALYLKGESHRINFGEYLESLANALLQSYGLAERVSIRMTSSNAVLGLNDAIPVGLLATEVISNSLKHAFPNRLCGSLEIAFAEDGSRNVLVIHDTGIGLPPGQRPPEIGAGMALVEALVAQVGGEAYYTSNGGTTFTLSLPRSDWTTRGTREPQRPAAAQSA